MEFSFHIPNVQKPMNLKQRPFNQETSPKVKNSQTTGFKKSTSLRSGSVKLNFDGTPDSSSNNNLNLNAFKIKVASPSNRHLEEVQFAYGSMKAIAENIEIEKNLETNKDKTVTPKATLKIEPNVFNSRMSFGVTQSDRISPNKINDSSSESYKLERNNSSPQK